MVLRAITGVRTPACLSATSNPVEAVTPPCVGWQLTLLRHSKNYLKYIAFPRNPLYLRPTQRCSGSFLCTFAHPPDLPAYVLT